MNTLYKYIILVTNQHHKVALLTQAIGGKIEFRVTASLRTKLERKATGLLHPKGTLLISLDS